MRANPQVQKELAAAIAETVLPGVFSEVVEAQCVVQNYGQLAKLASDDPATNAIQLALAVLDEYQRMDCVELLVRGLLRRDPGNSRFSNHTSVLMLKNIAPTGTASAIDEGENHQAAIAKRAQMLRSRDLLAFMSENEGKICAIVVEDTDDRGHKIVRTGTGFLVGPDLVMTARHVLGSHISGSAQNPLATGKRVAFFDHTDGAPITAPDQPALPQRVRRVEFNATRWLERASDALPRDGKYDAASPQEIQTMRDSLDTALIRLAEPIGLYSRRRSGGARRGWIEFPPAPSGLRFEDRIIIPQHPGGHPQQIDFGRFDHEDPSTTRIRYDTETEKGTSGAPCFNQGYELVGMHNAGYQVAPRPRLNQAIRLDHILKLVAGNSVQLPLPSRLWSVSDSESDPQVIVGRSALQDWITSAGAGTAAGIADRCLAVEGARPKCGKSFTTRILKAARRDMREHIVVLSEETFLVPQSAADFLRLLASQLRLSVADIEKMPPRPSGSLPNGGDGDKLSLWLSRDLPAWFARVLGKHRLETIDQREEARTFIKLQRERGIKPSAEDVKLAESTVPVLVSRPIWGRVWIVLDDIDEQKMSAELQELIPGLLGAGLSGQLLDPELSRLRWLFLGWKPQAIVGITTEKLDQADIDDEEIAECVRALVESLNTVQSPGLVETAVTMVRYALSVNPAAYDDLDTRLTTIQRVIGGLKRFLEEELRAI